MNAHFIGGPWDGKDVEFAYHGEVRVLGDEVGVRTNTGWHLYKPVGDTVDGKTAMLYWGAERH